MIVVKKYQWIFLILFSHSLRECFISETTNYAEVAHNDSTFSMIEEDLKHCWCTFSFCHRKIFTGKDVMM